MLSGIMKLVPRYPLNALASILVKLVSLSNKTIASQPLNAYGLILYTLLVIVN